MQRARNQLLAGSGLAGDERRSNVRGKPTDHAEEILHHRSPADHSAELESFGDVTLEREQTPASLRLLPNRGEELIETCEIQGLAEVIHRPQLDRFHRGLDRGVARHQHRLATRIHVANRANHIQAAEVWHPQIDQREIGVPRANLGDRLTPARAGNDFEAGTPRETVDDVTNSLLVVHDDEHRWLSGHTHSLAMARTADRMARS